MDLTFSFYGQDLPKVGDIVTIQMKEPDGDLIESTIEEYPGLSGIMEIADLTTKKRIKSVRQYLHKKPVPAEVTEVDGKTKIISLTRRYLKSSECLYNKYYGEKIRLLNIIRNLHRDFPEADINNFIKGILHPTMNKVYEGYDDKTKPPVIFDRLQVLFNADELPDYGDYNEAVLERLSKIYSEKPEKHITKFSLMCSVSVRNIIELFTELSTEYPKIKFKLETTPDYYFETFGLESDEKVKHKEILQVISRKCREKKISIKLI